MIYPIVIYGNEVLRKQCEEIAPDYPEVKKLVEDMFQTLGEAEGVGLAAPQIGKAMCLVRWPSGCVISTKTSSSTTRSSTD